MQWQTVVNGRVYTVTLFLGSYVWQVYVKLDDCVSELVGQAPTFHQAVSLIVNHSGGI